MANNNPSERFTLPTGGIASAIITAGQTTTQNFGVFLFGFAGVVPSTPALFASSSPDANTAYIRGLYEAILGRDANLTLMIPAETS